MREFARRYWVYAAVFIALCPLIFFRDYTPANELRYLSIAAEAIRDGHIFTFHNHGLAYADKPPLYFWGVMLGYRLFGSGCMPFVILFSFVPAVIATEVVVRMTSPLLDRRWQTAARLMLMTSGLFLVFSAYMRPDMLMVMFIVLAINSFLRQYQARKRGDGSKREQWLFGLWVFMALFSKGPYGVLIPLLSTLVFLIVKRDVKSFFSFWGWRVWAVLLGLCALWFGCVFAEGGVPYLNNLLFHQTVDRAVNSFHHKEPFWFYCETIWYSLVPWSIVVVAAIILGLCVAPKNGKRSDIEVLELCTAGTTFVLLSCVSSKMDLYLLPAIPFLIGSAVVAMRRFPKSKWVVGGLAFPAAVFIAIECAMPFIVRIKLLAGLDGYLYAAGGMLAAGGVAALVSLFKHKGERGVTSSVFALGLSMLAAVFTAGLATDRINDIAGYSNIIAKAESVAQQPGSGSPQVIYYRVKRVENIDVLPKKLNYKIIEDQKKIGLRPAEVAEGGALVIRKRDAKLASEVIEKAVGEPATVGAYLIYELPKIDSSNE